MAVPDLIHKLVRSEDGTEIYADAVGNPALPSVVFIHGITLSSIVFEGLFRDRTLLDTAYLVRYDLRGHGRSGKPLAPEAHESIRYAQDFAAVVKEFDLKRPYLFGWSLGATIAVDVLEHIRSDPLSGIIYACPMPYFGPITENLMKPLAAQIRDGRDGLLSSDAVTALDARIKFARSMFEDPDAVDRITLASYVGETVNVTAENVKLAVSKSQNPASLFAAGKAGLPLLILYSEDDAHFNNEVTVDEVGKYFENKKAVLVPHGGHAVFYGNQKRVVEEIIAFIGKKE